MIDFRETLRHGGVEEIIANYIMPMNSTKGGLGLDKGGWITKVTPRRRGSGSLVVGEKERGGYRVRL